MHIKYIIEIFSNSGNKKQTEKSVMKNQHREANIKATIRADKKIVLTTVIISTCFVISCFLVGCKKFVTVDPPATQLSDVTVFQDENSAIAALVNIYTGMSKGETFLIPYYTGLSSDELIDYSGNQVSVEFNTNSLQPTNVELLQLWNNAYKYIYASNAIIEGVNLSSSLSDKIKRQLSGEAKFIRAFWSFYLVNFFGDIPLALTTDYKINSVLGRSASGNVYTQIVSDLTEAEQLLTDDYLDGNNQPSVERVRPNKTAVTAFLARVYLYMNEWQKAEDATSKVLNDSRFDLVENLNEVFLKDSREAIWQLMPVNHSYNTLEGNQFIQSSQPAFGLSPSLLSSFEAGDQRKLNWIDSITNNGTTFYFSYKYKIKSISPGTEYTEYSIVLRLAEQFLIRAEARINLGNLQGASDDLNRIRVRAGLTPITNSDISFLKLSLYQERNSELFTEWSHRWFDLKRLTIADSILGSLKAPNWQTTDILYAIPQSEILVDSRLIQNPGY